jgi:hypothetical protein
VVRAARLAELANEERAALATLTSGYDRDVALWLIAAKRAALLGEPAPEAPPPSFLARDLLALLSPADRIAIDRALRARDAAGDLTAAAAGLTLLWESLQAQGDAPIHATAERFLTGWAGLSAALGPERAAEIAAALGIAAPPAG